VAEWHALPPRGAGRWGGFGIPPAAACAGAGGRGGAAHSHLTPTRGFAKTAPHAGWHSGPPFFFSSTMSCAGRHSRRRHLKRRRSKEGPGGGPGGGLGEGLGGGLRGGPGWDSPKSRILFRNGQKGAGMGSNRSQAIHPSSGWPGGWFGERGCRFGVPAGCRFGLRAGTGCHGGRGGPQRRPALAPAIGLARRVAWAHPPPNPPRPRSSPEP
jgi:hypothetical protein